MAADIFLRIFSSPLAIALVLLFFGGSIFVHELGHYLAARWRGLRIDRFSIGFGPKILGWKDRRGCEWRLAPIPLGGYVALPQLADLRGIESEGEEPAEALPPISYADKVWVAVAGAAFNVIFALVLGTVLWITGLDVPAYKLTTQVGWVAQTLPAAEGREVPGPAAQAGVLPGDIIRTVDGRPVGDFEELTYAITTGVGRDAAGAPQLQLGIERAGQLLNLVVAPALDPIEGLRQIGVSPADPLLIESVYENSPAALAGLQAGDRLVRLNGEPLHSTRALSQAVQAHPESSFALDVVRADQTLAVTLRPEKVVINTAGETLPMLGVRWKFVTELRHIDPLTQIGESLSSTFKVLKALVHPQSDVGINNLSGPVGIGYTLYIFSQIGLRDLLAVVLLININLAVLNLMPIPVLDGGHIVYATLSRLLRRPLPVRFITATQTAFVVVFLGLALYVSFFDVGRVGRSERDQIAAEREAKQAVPIVFKGPSAS